MTKEFGIRKEGGDKLQFSDLEDSTLDIVKKPLSQISFMTRYLCECFDDKHKGARWSEDGKYDSTFRGGTFYRDVKGFVDQYKQWMEEMNNNKVSFAPVSFSGEWNTTLCGLSTSKYLGFGGKIDSSDLDERMNGSYKSLTNEGSEFRFMELFYMGTEKLLIDKYKF